LRRNLWRDVIPYKDCLRGKEHFYMVCQPPSHGSIMVLENLGGSLRNALKKIASANKIDKALVDDAVREIQRALLQADVNVKLVMLLSNTIKERARHQHRLSGADQPGRPRL
jgi:hypothetical protein